MAAIMTIAMGLFAVVGVFALIFFGLTVGAPVLWQISNYALARCSGCGRRFWLDTPAVTASGGAGAAGPQNWHAACYAGKLPQRSWHHP